MTWWISIFTRGALLALIWWALTDGNPSSWWIGIPAVLVALITSFALMTPCSLSWVGLLRFIPFFFIRSLLGGMDVARRALLIRMPIQPDIVIFPMQLEQELPKVMVANVASLLPGTLSAEIHHDALHLHVLDNRNDVTSELMEVEQHIARIFGIELSSSKGDR